MAAKTTLNARNLEALGAQRLSELLIEISTGNAAHKRRLRMELVGNHSSAELAREVRKRLTSIARARTFIDWRKVKALKADLEVQRKTIVDVVAADDPQMGLELIWQFLDLASPIFERSNDSSGSLVQSFHQACTDAGVIATAATVDLRQLAENVFKSVQDNGYGQYDHLISAMVPALGKNGLDHLKDLFVQWRREPTEKTAKEDRRVIGWGSQGPVYEDEIYGNHRDLTVRISLQEIADAQGDVDAYIAQQPQNTRQSPMIAADIANRLLSAGRAGEALTTLDKVETRGRLDVPFEWQLARAEALDALGRGGEAQAFRWKCFEQWLSEQHLRAFLKRLPDFDDVEAEENALSYAQSFSDPHRALVFFLRWPALGEAAKIVLHRRRELDGDLYELMTPAAEALAERHPLAATLVLRSMIDFILDGAKSSRYKHAARHLAECGALARRVTDFDGAELHDAYLAGLQRRHKKKYGFWEMVS